MTKQEKAEAKRQRRQVRNIEDPEGSFSNPQPTHAEKVKAYWQVKASAVAARTKKNEERVKLTEKRKKQSQEEARAQSAGRLMQLASRTAKALDRRERRQASRKS